MLVLTRTHNQAVMIGDDISVTVADIRGDKVRLAFQAPRNIKVHRKEVYDQIKNENQSASELRPEDVGAVVASPTPNLKIAKDRADDRFIEAAIEEARKSETEGGLPIGAVLVRAGKIIGRGHDRTSQTRDLTAIAELECVRNAREQNTYGDTVLYTTLAPGDLAVALATHLGIRKIVAGEAQHRRGGTGVGRSSGKVAVEVLNDRECEEMVTDFNKRRPGVWPGFE